MPDKKVALNPAQFAEDGGLLDLSLEEVVSLFIDKEKHRHRDAKDDENQQEAMVTSRIVPTGLLLALDGNARRLGITRALLTRCLSHQIVSWIDSLPRVGQMVGMFNVVCDAAEEFGYPDLYDSMKPNYLFANESSRGVSLRTIGWVRNKMQSLSPALGISSSGLFLVGLCYSLTHAGVATKGTVGKYLSVEVEKFLSHVDERSVWVVGFNDLVRKRAQREGLDGSTIT